MITRLANNARIPVSAIADHYGYDLNSEASPGISGINRRRTLLRSSVCLLSAAVMSSLGATSAQAALPTSLVSACSGVSLPRSVVTNIVRTPLNSIVSPIQGTVNSILGVVGVIPIVGKCSPTSILT